jgi:hypothetical protein
MNAMPKNEDEHRWALFMMGTMDEMIYDGYQNSYCEA